MNATMKEVAKRAQVSTATVSRVFNNSGPVDEKTRREVRRVAEELRYVPNAAGRSLSTKRTDAVGLLLPDLYGEFFSEVIRGADQTAQQHRLHIVVSSSHNHPEEIKAALRMMRGRVDGLIIMSPHIDAQTLDANLPRTLPVVLMNCYVKNGSFDSLNVDNFGGACEMVRHLRWHGHKHIAMIKGIEKNNDAEERLRGYRAAMEEAGSGSPPGTECDGDFSEESGYNAVRRILGMTPRPTAIFAANDSMAIGALGALHDQGISVPGDIALAGFDDIPIGRFIKPSLSSVRVQISELGAIAVQRLVHAIREKNNHLKQQTVLPTTIIARESCGCGTSLRNTRI
jgi:LacI family transcriptional regulator